MILNIGLAWWRSWVEVSDDKYYANFFYSRKAAYCGLWEIYSPGYHPTFTTLPHLTSRFLSDSFTYRRNRYRLSRSSQILGSIPSSHSFLPCAFQRSWANATKRQREHLIDLICRLAEEDRDGLMVHKVLNLLWDLAVDSNSLVEISDFALKAHAKILDHNISVSGACAFLPSRGMQVFIISVILLSHCRVD